MKIRLLPVHDGRLLVSQTLVSSSNWSDLYQAVSQIIDQLGTDDCEAFLPSNYLIHWLAFRLVFGSGSAIYSLKAEEPIGSNRRWDAPVEVEVDDGLIRPVTALGRFSIPVEHAFICPECHRLSRLVETVHKVESAEVIELGKSRTSYGEAFGEEISESTFHCSDCGFKIDDRKRLMRILLQGP